MLFHVKIILCLDIATLVRPIYKIVFVTLISCNGVSVTAQQSSLEESSKKPLDSKTNTGRQTESDWDRVTVRLVRATLVIKSCWWPQSLSFLPVGLIDICNYILWTVKRAQTILGWNGWQNMGLKTTQNNNIYSLKHNPLAMYLGWATSLMILWHHILFFHNKFTFGVYIL